MDEEMEESFNRREESFNRSDLESWWRSPITKALMEDLRERKEDSVKISLLSGPLGSVEKVAEVNKEIGIIENIEYVLAFPSLILDDILNKEEKRKEGEKT